MTSMPILPAGTNPWKYCNYDDVAVGFPRECDPNNAASQQWNTFDVSKIVSSRMDILFEVATEGECVRVSGEG